MKAFLSTLAALSLTLIGMAQVQLERQVIGTSGSTGGNNDLRVDYTVGEPFVTTLTTPDLILTQGFHQSDATLVGMRTPNGIKWETRHFPNPTHSQLSVEVEGNVTGRLTMQVVDVQGQVVYRQQVEKGFGTLYHQILVEPWADGTYFLQLQKGDQAPVSLPFQKIH